MSSFSLPPIHDNPDGGWGPSTSNFPDQFKFKDIPYAPYSKSDKLGRFADWNDISSDNRQSVAGLPPTQSSRGGGPGGRRRDGNQAFGSGTASAFAYFHVEDESSFSLVDNKAAPARRGTGFSRGRGNVRGTTPYGARGASRGIRGGPAFRGGANQRGGVQRRGGWRDWEKVCIFTSPPDLCLRFQSRATVLGKLQSLSLLNGACLKKLNSTGLPNCAWRWTSRKNCMCNRNKFIAETNKYTRDSYGRLFAYEKSYDRVTTKTEKVLQLVDRIKYNTTTSDDPVIQQVSFFLIRIKF